MKLLLLCGIWSVAGLAATISGRVYDPSGSAIPKAVVTIIKGEKGERKTVTAGDDGTFTSPNLGSGTYEVRAVARGFAVFVTEGIRIENNVSVELNPMLRLAEVTESVEVEAPGRSRAQANRPQRIRVGGNVQTTRLVNYVKPDYPETARAEGREGTVIFQGVISVEGKLLSLTQIDGADPDLAAAAEKAVKQWNYQPMKLNGVPVEVVTVIEVRFRLKG